MTATAEHATRAAARIAAVSGFLFAGLFVAALVLLHRAPNLSDPDQAYAAFYAGGGDQIFVAVGLYLVPYAGIAFLRANAAKFHLDPARIFAAGHSMGGFMAASATAHDPKIAGLVLISSANLGAIGREVRDPGRRKFWLEDEFRDDVYPLAGTTADKLLDETIAHTGNWDLGAWAPEIGKRPVLIITSDDGLAPHVAPLAKALGGQATQVQFADDHSYSDHRIALETAVLDWLAKR